MAYTIAQFITQAEAGGAIQVTKPAGSTGFLLQIGGRSIMLTDILDTRVAPTNPVSGVPTDTIINTSILDLGTLFTANQVLDSYSLREAIITGAVTADAGTVALSKMPVV